MTIVHYKLKQFVGRLAAFLPSPLPRGLAEYDRWSSSIISTYGLPDNDSIRFSLAVMVMHAESTAAYKPKRFFGMSALKAMSNQVASQVIQDLKAKQAADHAAAQAAEAAKLAEATANPPAVVSDGPQV